MVHGSHLPYLYWRGTAVPGEVDGRILDGGGVLLRDSDLRLRPRGRGRDQVTGVTVPRRDDLEVGVVGLALGQRLQRRPQELHAAVAERQVEG